MEVAADVRRFVDAVTPERRRRDAETLLKLMHRATGEAPRLQHKAIGFGEYHYRYESGREGDAAAARFAPRKAATSVYLMDGVAAHAIRPREARDPTRQASVASTSRISTTSTSRSSSGSSRRS